MFSSLGKEDKYTKFSSPTKVMNISLLPTRGENGDKNYISVVDIDGKFTEKFIASNPDHSNNSMFTTSDVDDEDNKDIFSLGKDSIKTFYIGSITVIGLFILFRFMNK